MGNLGGRGLKALSEEAKILGSALPLPHPLLQDHPFQDPQDPEAQQVRAKQWEMRDDGTQSPGFFWAGS